MMAERTHTHADRSVEQALWCCNDYSKNTRLRGGWQMGILPEQFLQGRGLAGPALRATASTVMPCVARYLLCPGHYLWQLQLPRKINFLTEQSLSTLTTHRLTQSAGCSCSS